MGMAGTRALFLMLAAVIAVGPASAQVHHVVGGDRGWDPSSNISDWSSSKFFRVGDKIWFMYSAASEGVLELGSRDEYETCDVSNPIRMYTDGLVQVNLDTEGSRYFTSNRLESCKNGLKLHVHVQPQANADSQEAVAAAKPVTVHELAAAPTTPSGSSAVQFSSMMGPGLVLAWLMAFGKF